MNVPDFLALLRAPARASLTALETPAGPMSYAELNRRVHEHAQRLVAHETSVVASLVDNGAEWIIQDLACMQVGLVHLPLPLFFTPEQLRATLRAAGAGMVVINTSMRAMLSDADIISSEDLSDTLSLCRLPTAPASIHTGTAKITFTSGSTGHPRGVCLGAREMLSVANGLAHATKALEIRRHLTALPLPVLLENIAGVYAPLMEGAAVIARSLGEVGLQGSSHFDAAVFHAALDGSGAQSVIVLPQMLRAYVWWLRTTGTGAPSNLRLMAVGGAAVGAELLAGARALGLPAYEGYGLSEACSVQTLNLPNADCPGSAGRALPHAQVRVAVDGEIEVAGSHALGYLGQPPSIRTWMPTGDLGYLDAAGFLHVQGRKKNVLITGFGRNVSPEWIELHLTSQQPIARAVVLGEGQPFLGAVIWPIGDASDDAIRHCLEQINQTLPDYARIGTWMRARAEFSAETGMATANGRPRRDAVAECHADLFENLSSPPFS